RSLMSHSSKPTRANDATRRNGRARKEAPPAAASPPSEPEKPAVIDPFDPATYKVAPTLDAAAGVKRHVGELEVRAPASAWWVRVHEDPAYHFSAWTIDLRDRNESYLVPPSIWPDLVGEATFKPRAFFLAVTLQGKPFLWSVRRPADESGEL